MGLPPDRRVDARCERAEIGLAKDGTDGRLAPLLVLGCGVGLAERQGGRWNGMISIWQ